MSNDDEWKLPKRREVIDLEGKPALPPLPNTPVSFGPAALDEPPLELDPRPAPEITPPKRRWPIVPLVVLLVLASAAVAGWQVLAHRAPANGGVDLVNVPPGAHLLLDGVPIEGTHLLLQKSVERHAVTLLRAGMPPKIVRFVVDGNATIDLSK